MREFIATIIVVACALMLLCGISGVWDYNENAYDAKMNRFYDEREIPTYCYLNMPYIGSKKTKIIHKLDSQCLKDVEPRDTILLFKEEAIKAGYKHCQICQSVRN